MRYFICVLYCLFVCCSFEFENIYSIESIIDLIVAIVNIPITLNLRLLFLDCFMHFYLLLLIILYFHHLLKPLQLLKIYLQWVITETILTIARINLWAWADNSKI